MANDIIRPDDLPPRANPVASEVVPSDNGVIVAGVTWADGVNAGRPLASKGEAEAGENAAKAMVPLTTKQAIDAQVPAIVGGAISGLGLGSAAQADVGDFATAAQGGLADTAVQPGDLATVATSGSYNDLTDRPSLGGDLFDTVPAALADNNVIMGYAGSGAANILTPGQVIGIAGFRYEVAASDATDFHLETVGGVRLRALRGVGATSVLAFGIFADGATDMAAQLQKAFDSHIPWLHFPAGTYVLGSDATCSRSIKLTGEPGAIIDCSGANSKIYLLGSAEQISDLATDVTVSTQTISLVDATGVVPGDVLWLNDPTPRGWFGAAGNRDYRKGEMVKVAIEAADDVTIYGLTCDSYDAASTDVYRLTPMEVIIEDLYFIAGTTQAFRIEFCTKVRATNIGGISSADRVGHFSTCYDTAIDNSSATNISNPSTGTNYGLGIGDMHIVSYIGGAGSSRRHALAIGGGARMPNRFVRIIGAYLENHSNASVGAGDMHGCVEFVEYVDCTFASMVHMAGANVSIIGGHVFHGVTQTHGLCVYASEIAGGTYLIDGLTLHTEGDLAQFALITLSPIYEMREDLHIVIKNITVVSRAGGSNNARILDSISSADQVNKVDVTIDGVSGKLPGGLYAVARIRRNDGNLASDGIIIDSISLKAPSGSKRLLEPHSSIDAVPRREMKQIGRVNHTTTAAVVNAPALINFPYRYSKLPATLVGVSSADGSAVTGGTLADKVLVPLSYQVTDAGIRPGVASSDGANLSAGTSICLSWEAGVMEV